MKNDLINKKQRLAKKKSETEILKAIAIDAVLDKKGRDVVSLDLRKIKDTPSDFFIITHGESGTQVKALFDSVVKAAREKGYEPYHTEGSRNSEWIIIDFVDVVVHIFHRDKRDFYALEDLWNDAKLSRHTEVAQKSSATINKR